MQVLDEQSKAYFNFINSLKSESTRKLYTYCIEKFLGHYEKDLDQFLSLSQDEMTNLIIKYLLDNKISTQHKNLMISTLKHACEINDVILNWKKIKSSSILKKQEMKPMEGIEVIPLTKFNRFWNFQTRELEQYF